MIGTADNQGREIANQIEAIRPNSYSTGGRYTQPTRPSTLHPLPSRFSYLHPRHALGRPIQTRPIISLSPRTLVPSLKGSGNHHRLSRATYGRTASLTQGPRRVRLFTCVAVLNSNITGSSYGRRSTARDDRPQPQMKRHPSTRLIFKLVPGLTTITSRNTNLSMSANCSVQGARYTGPSYQLPTMSDEMDFHPHNLWFGLNESGGLCDGEGWAY